MGIYFYDGGVLFDSGQIAFDEACCCDGPKQCGHCSSLVFASTPVLTLNGIKTKTGNLCSGSPCQDCPNGCSSLNGLAMAASFVTGGIDSCQFVTSTVRVYCYIYTTCTGWYCYFDYKWNLYIMTDPYDSTKCLMRATNNTLGVFEARSPVGTGFTSPVTLTAVGTPTGFCDWDGTPTVTVTW